MSRLPAIDAYIANARPFAQPILIHLRDTMHRVVPEVEEQIKWSMPFFVYRGVILGNMAAHKEHCSFGLWGKEVTSELERAGVATKGNMGSLGRITSLEDLPPAADLDAYLRRAAELIGNGTRTKSIERAPVSAPRPEVEIPAVLTSALASNKTAEANFARMSASHRRGYAEWIADAKREDTRNKRVATAVEWIAEGKGRNWKYERQPS